MSNPDPAYQAICDVVGQHGLTNTLRALADYAGACAHVDIKDGGDGHTYMVLAEAVRNAAEYAQNA